MWLAQIKAQKLARQLNGNILERTLDMLRSDDDLEQFSEAIPGFFVSQIVDDPRRSLDILGQQRLAETLVQFWNRTLSSNRVSESVKGRRLIVCLKVIEAADLSFALPRILHLFSRDHSGVSRSAEIGHSLGVLRNGNGALLTRGIIASIISINDERDERWFALAIDELGIPEDVLRRYLDHGDSVLLANLIHITRQFFQNLLQRGSDLTMEPLRILPLVSKFDILNTLPDCSTTSVPYGTRSSNRRRVTGLAVIPLLTSLSKFGVFTSLPMVSMLLLHISSLTPLVKKTFCDDQPRILYA
ncbi:hypothetical protein BJV77DRAFT_374513 [Russula vinacea]|nr:hypothetical protein BJV77DRAFT_374513 [Russula vinacea]